MISAEAVAKHIEWVELRIAHLIAQKEALEVSLATRRQQLAELLCVARIGDTVTYSATGRGLLMREAVVKQIKWHTVTKWTALVERTDGKSEWIRPTHNPEIKA